MLAPTVRVAPIALAPGRFVAAVTELAELLRCERRYFYKIVAGLEEHADAGPLSEIAEADEADLPGIDRLARGQLAHRVLELVDYKHASGKGQDPDAYGFQLRTYALAAARILPGEAPLQVGIAWLRDRGAAPALQAIERSSLAAHEARLAALGDALSRARASGKWEKLEAPSACGDCGFARRCWGSRV
jgi:hypothetical protein